jgi:hypothetical protein
LLTPWIADLRCRRFYADLEKLRLLRNRVHIQNTKDKTLPAKEYNVFTTAQKDLAEQVTEKTLRTLSRTFDRRSGYSDLAAHLAASFE